MADGTCSPSTLTTVLVINCPAIELNCVVSNIVQPHGTPHEDASRRRRIEGLRVYSKGFHNRLLVNRRLY
jgi:hypothetical protein